MRQRPGAAAPARAYVSFQAPGRRARDADARDRGALGGHRGAAREEACRECPSEPVPVPAAAGTDGIETTRRLRAADPAPHVPALTTYGTDDDVTRAVDAGATGCLLKTERAEDLFTALHAAAQGRPALSPPVAGRVLSRLRNPRPALTPRERDILAQLAQGLPHHAVARVPHIGEATVKTRLRRIHDKLGVNTRAGAVAVAEEQRLLP
ncbi:LuxR C-terminal-related transcriptional regulator [Streptomyces misionensis]|uniref:LuxR C-terminal-related transcriptional regulator n=1 Tax=Streptomyces misionensis TaxID=67331 RepID=UPI003F4C7E47